MEIWKSGDQRFEVVMASNVVDDGMALELSHVDGGPSGPVAVAFFSDHDHSFTFTMPAGGSLPFEILERFVAKARGSLPVDTWECPVCGAEELTSRPYATWPPPAELKLVPPYENQLGTPSYEVCPNCGFEFGNDDNPGTAPPDSFESYREDWVGRGSPRFTAGG